MKTAGIWLALFSAIFSLLLFQAIWLHNVYKIEKKELHERTNKTLEKSIETELNIRAENRQEDKGKGFDFEFDTQIDSTKRSIVLDDDEIIEAGIMQQALNLMGYIFNFNTLDSIFKSELQETGLPFNYYLSYKDSTKAIIEQTDNVSLSTKNNAFHSDSRLIVGGKRVQAIVDISPFAVFKQMIGLLVASFIMLIVIMFCIFFQAKTVFNEYKLNKLRKDFTDTLAHDMKTPLGTINTVLDNFRSGVFNNSPEKQEKHGKTAMDQVENLLLLIEKTLTITRIEDKKYTLSRTKANMYLMIKELENRFSVLKNKHITIQTSVDIDENEDIYIDTILIKNAISNLIENAIKYSGNSVKITINCFLLNNELYITVKDNVLTIVSNGLDDEYREMGFTKYTIHIKFKK